jgi:hypothetical protein
MSQRDSSLQLYPTNSFVSHFISSHNRGMSYARGIVLLLAILLLAACGPQRASDADMRTDTVRIAQEYEQSGDLSRARVQLDALSVANPTQWLILLAESRALEASGEAETTALVRLTLALGVQSGTLMQYAVQFGLIAAPEPTPVPPVAAAVPTVAIETLPVIEAAPAAQAAPAAEAPTPEAAAPQTAASAPPAADLIPTATPVPKAMLQASNALNVRSGPGTAYPVIGALNAADQAEIVAKNPQGDWWQITLPNGQSGWVFGALVQTSGDMAMVAVASNIPEPPPTPTPAPIAVAPDPPPLEAPPAPQAPPPSAPPSDGPDFVVIEKRLWDVWETGGRLDGPSVRCGEKRELHVNVVDINGVRINGVAVQAEFGAREIYVTGSQGKGDGKSEFVLGEGQDVRVIRDADGREVTSEVARGMSTRPAAISYDDLRAGQYCTDDASCASFVGTAGCWGHFSWTVTFQRRY